MLIYEMIAGFDPFFAEDTLGIYRKILKGRVKFNKSFDIASKALIKGLLNVDPAKRLGSSSKTGIFF